MFLSKDLPVFPGMLSHTGVTHPLQTVLVFPLPGRKKSKGQAGQVSVPGPRLAGEADPSRKAGKSLCLTSFDLD